MRDAFRVDFGLLLRHVGRYRGEPTTSRLSTTLIDGLFRNDGVFLFGPRLTWLTPT